MINQRRTSNGMNKYRAVVIGCGRIGALFEGEKNRAKPASHAGAILANSRTKLVALADPDRQNRAKAKKLFPHAHYYAAAEECIRLEQPDIVCIATPSPVRLPLVKACVQYGVRMIICEKPLALTLRDAREIQKIVDHSKLAFVLNYQRRFSRLFEKVRKDIERGVIGRIQQVSCRYSNGLFNNGGHMIDSLKYLLEDPIVSLAALDNNRNKTHPKGDINADAFLVSKNGTHIILQSFDQKEFAIHDMIIFGEKGAIAISDFGQKAEWFPAKNLSFAGLRALSEKPSTLIRAPLSATAGTLAEIIRAHENKRRPRSGLENGVYVLEVLDAIARSARSGGKLVKI